MGTEEIRLILVFLSEAQLLMSTLLGSPCLPFGHDSDYISPESQPLSVSPLK